MYGTHGNLAGRWFWYLPVTQPALYPDFCTGIRHVVAEAGPDEYEPVHSAQVCAGPYPGGPGFLPAGFRDWQYDKTLPAWCRGFSWQCTYLLHTTGELCLSPIGLSMVTKLADEKEVGLAMGGWFLSIAMAQYVAGIIAALASGGTNSGAHGEETVAATITQYSGVYMQLFWIGLIVGLAYLVLAPLINKLMHGVK